jgi:hypothetical protein
MADPASDSGITYQLGAFAGAFVAALIAWFTALRKKPETTQSQAFADSDLRTQLLVSQLKQEFNELADHNRENLRLVIEAARVGLENKIGNSVKEQNDQIGRLNERLRKMEISQARHWRDPNN